MQRGDFVLCNFPFHGIEGPGPSPHIVLCAATGGAGATRFAIVFYTTTQTGYAGTRRPRQFLFVDEARAKALNQRNAFQIDAGRVARLPLTHDYFPTMAADGPTVIASSVELAERVEQRLRELLSGGVPIRRSDLVKR